MGKIFTWVDIDSQLAEVAIEHGWPDWLTEVDAWWDSLELTVAPGTTPEIVRTWLDQQFGLGSIATPGADDMQLILDRPSSQSPESLPVRLIENSSSLSVPRSPRLRERRVTSALSEPLPRPKTDRFAEDRQITAFHSFKGGVGRTLHALALADRLASQGQHVLLIDADLEAPGITWMYQAQGGRCDIAYEDLLALLHSSSQGDPTKAVEIAASYLPNQQASRYPGTGRVSVLPASRRKRLSPPIISPDDLLTEDRSPYFLSDSLAKLAIAANVDTVIIDLRAGATELSAPILLDPRVNRVFVTTVSDQSLQGTEGLIRQLGDKSPALAGTDPIPSAIVTQFRIDLHDAHASEARETLSRALSSMIAISDTETEEHLSVDEQVLTAPILSPFREELLALPRNWDSVIEVIRRCSLPVLLDELGTSLRSTPEPPPQEPASLDERRRSLAESAGELVYAERRGMDHGLGFLTTEPVRRIISDHSTDLPVAVMVGAKGSGKTFTFARMCARGTWKNFAEENEQSVERNASFVPVLDPVNISESRHTSTTPQQLRDIAAGGEGITADRILSLLNAGLNSEESDPENWLEIWLECLARAAGKNAEGSPQDYLMGLSQDPSRAFVFVIDGLEDWLETLNTEAKRIALRTLLLGVPAWMRRLRQREIGLIVFIRRDLVVSAIRQNLGQFLDRYSPYELRWDTEDALRLALWVSTQANSIPTPKQPISDMGDDALVEALLPLWGAKLGSEKSREASSDRWVPAALADFNDQIQARDIVRFLREAAKSSQGDNRWDDRVLTPAAMRRALSVCSEEKIQEIRQENPPLGELLTQMSEYPDVKVPFEAEDLNLKTEHIDALRQWGALAKDADGRYRMPEIYRHALGFRTQGRARVVRTP
ncbi:ParA family protein [Nocardiopsis sp. NPDC006938]|uniref:ParA family protein n=1 Tax=Nocardiopsis sp. NPDC006938 TaxID=3364337 RepID=UPI0036ACA4AE